MRQEHTAHLRQAVAAQLCVGLGPERVVLVDQAVHGPPNGVRRPGAADLAREALLEAPQLLCIAIFVLRALRSFRPRASPHGRQRRREGAGAHGGGGQAGACPLGPGEGPAGRAPLRPEWQGAWRGSCA